MKELNRFKKYLVESKDSVSSSKINEQDMPNLTDIEKFLLDHASESIDYLDSDYFDDLRLELFDNPHTAISGYNNAIKFIDMVGVAQTIDLIEDWYSEFGEEGEPMAMQYPKFSGDRMPPMVPLLTNEDGESKYEGGELNSGSDFMYPEPVANVLVSILGPRVLEKSEIYNQLEKIGDDRLDDEDREMLQQEFEFLAS